MKQSYKIGDVVKHNVINKTAVIAGIRYEKKKRQFVYRLDFGGAIIGAFGINYNNKEFFKTAFKPVKKMVCVISDSYDCSGMTDNEIKELTRSLVAYGYEGEAYIYDVPTYKALAENIFFLGYKAYLVASE